MSKVIADEQDTPSVLTWGAVVYVALIELKYSVIAVAASEAEAVKLVSEKAHQFLKNADALYPETETPELIVDYFGVSVTRIKVGTAEYVGNE